MNLFETEQLILFHKMLLVHAATSQSFKPFGFGIELGGAEALDRPHAFVRQRLLGGFAEMDVTIKGSIADLADNFRIFFGGAAGDDGGCVSRHIQSFPGLQAPLS
jgi:hypothetical protein